jgi:1-acyl-sn-glycerol-3-phosphate acyltransferase
VKKIPFHFAWIMLSSAGATIYYSLKTLFYAHKKVPSRQKLNEVITAWARSLLHIIDLKYDIIDTHPIQFQEHTPYIFMSNHLSLYDIPLLLVSLPGTVRMVAKKELFKVPLWGDAMQQSDFVSIDRENAAQAVKDLESAAQKMKQGIRLWIAPEGTRSHDGQLQAFKKGAFNLAIQTGAIIIPVTIIGTDQILPAKTWQFRLGQKAVVHLGAPIDAKLYTLRDRMKLLQRVREAIAAPLGAEK